MPDAGPLFGEKCDYLRVKVTDRYSTLDIDSATVTIKSLTGAVLRNAVAATVSSPYAFYVETYNGTNGYAEEADYVATVRVTCDNGAQIPALEIAFRVLAAADA